MIRKKELDLGANDDHRIGWRATHTKTHPQAQTSLNIVLTITIWIKC